MKIRNEVIIASLGLGILGLGLASYFSLRHTPSPSQLIILQKIGLVKSACLISLGSSLLFFIPSNRLISRIKHVRAYNKAIDTYLKAPLLETKTSEIKPTLHTILTFDDGKKLIESDSVINESLPKSNLTPLHCLFINFKQIANDEFHKILTLLLLNGSDIHAKDSQGLTPLHYAVLCDKKAIEQLLNKGALVNATDKQGRTPLHLLSAKKEWLFYSAIFGKNTLSTETQDIRQFLIEQGANPHALDNAGLDPNTILERNRSIA